MPGITDLFAKGWKRMIAMVVLSLLAVGIIVFLKPLKYLSIATAIPASSFASDKSRIFNENIHEVYPSPGTPDNLAIMVGTANLDTVYLAVTARFNLFDHYKMKEKGEAAVKKAASLLKRNTTVMKSKYGELKVKVWDTDKNLAPQLANAIIDQLQVMYDDLQSAGNRAALNGLLAGKKKLLLQLDSLTAASGIETERKKMLEDQLQQYEKLSQEYRLLVDIKLPVLLVVEKARVSAWPDKPKRISILVVTGFLGFLFSLLASWVLEKRKSV